MVSRTTFAVLAVLTPPALASPQVQAHDGPPPVDPVGELRRSFMLGGSPVPPLVFRDMGDGDPADLKPMLVTVDAWAAIGSDRFGQDISRRDGWTSQADRRPRDGQGAETEAYRYLGATPEGLLVVVTANATSNAGYAPATLHVLSAAVTKAMDVDGKPYDRVDLTTLAAYPLGDRWSGEATLSGDTVTVVTRAGAGLPSRSAAGVGTYRISRP